MLEVKNLSKSFGTLQAVNHISFQVQKGEVVGLLGPNGAGKTTTMRLITGFLKPEEGDIIVGGVNAIENGAQVRRTIGYLPENAPSYHDMEVVAFLNYIARLRQIPHDQQSASIKEVVDICGLGTAVGRNIGQLSRGFKQRVCLAQALIHKPPLLILDEPTTGLDPHQIQEIRNLIKELGKERIVIFSTHIMQEVEAVCQRVIIMTRGEIVKQGTLEEVTEKRTLSIEKVFLETAK